ncbi:hypothetical protein [Alkalibacillus aidingensis]|uniref:hypothetical protein n=1 Tax=Alkalibacillus aidingensis TaxID=2747607 RepID=UPI0016606C81|nr:hypothetical protein [Alkalibacillus aidingensis]
MTAVMQLLPIAMILVIIVLIAFSVTKGASVMVPVRIRQNQTRYILSGYSVLLIMAAITYIWMADEHAVDYKSNGYELGNGDYSVEEISPDEHALRTGDADQLDDMAVNYEWEFDLEDHEIKIDQNQNTHDGLRMVPIYVKENSALNQQVSVKHYTPETVYLSGVALQDHIPAPIIDQSFNTLHFRAMAEKFFDYKLITDEAVTSRFTDVQSWLPSMSHVDSNIRMQAIVIEVPSGVRVTQGDISHFYDLREETES